MAKNTPLLALLLAPAYAAAQNNAVQGGLQTSGLQSLFGYSGTGLSGSQNLVQFIGSIINLLLTFAGAIAIVFVIIGGYWYITSGGNEEQAEKGQKTLTNAIIGVVVVILSYVIINVIVNLVSSSNSYGY